MDQACAQNAESGGVGVLPGLSPVQRLDDPTGSTVGPRSTPRRTYPLPDAHASHIATLLRLHINGGLYGGIKVVPAAYPRVIDLEHQGYVPIISIR